MQNSRLLVLHALSPVHVGTGRGEGLIDLPVARDAVTEHPIIPGSGVKGPIRAAFGSDDGPDSETKFAVFGPPVDRAHDHGSAVRFSDARLLAMPVPSDHGTFAWVSSPLVLQRLARDAGGLVQLPKITAPKDDACACVDNAAVVSPDQTAILDGTPFKTVPLRNLAEYLADLVFPHDRTWRDLLVARFVLVSDDVFDAFARNGTDVRAHIRIDEGTGTVARGGLWYEESVPAEAVFVSVVQLGGAKATADQAYDAVSKALGDTVTFGGGKTTGMGLMRGHLHPGGGQHARR